MVEIRPLTETLQKVAIEELGEVPSRIAEDLKALKTWIQDQAHLKSRTDDQFLIQFLRGCKYSLEKAKGKLDLFYAMKTKYPELFLVTDVDSAPFRKLHNSGFYTVLPKPINDCGPRIIVIRFPSKELNVREYFPYFATMVEVLLMNDDYANIYGFTAIMDFAGATANQLMQISMKAGMQNAIFYEKAVPVRLKNICCINLSKHAEQFLNMLLPIVPKKFRERFVLIGKNLNDLSKHIPKKYLPRDYGGENGSFDQLSADYNKVWDEHREYFKQNSEYGTEERLRVGKPFDFDGDLGIGGSFRKLNVD